MAMDWTKVTQTTRFQHGISASEEAGLEPTLSEFQKDARRIIYSTQFRRLQGKTQVHPFPQTDYLRTRLTHTIEVGNIGRSIADGIEKELIRRKEVDAGNPCFGDIVYAACLAHDLGNPPFGHVGEYAIQSWFKKAETESKIVSEVLSERTTRNDFVHFDGNAQSFRILTRLAGWRGEGGLRLTNATIAASCKYPYTSVYSTEAKKKYGFQRQELEYAKSIFDTLGMVKEKEDCYKRHPLAFVSEAADDICYLTTDIEDAFRSGHIKIATALEALKAICEKGNTMGHFNQISDTEPQDKIAYLRWGAVSALIVAAIENFGAEHNQIMAGNYRGSLIETKRYKTAIEHIRETCRNEIYTERRKIETETAGIKVINELMDLYGGMIIRFVDSSGNLESLSTLDRHVYHLLPKDFQETLKTSDPYHGLLILLDYISGMTDRYALDLFSKLTGVSPSLGRMA